MIPLVEGRLILKNASLRDGGGAWSTGMTLVVAGEVIAQRGADATLPALPGDWVIDCRSRAVIRGRRDDRSAWAYGLSAFNPRPSIAADEAGLTAEQRSVVLALGRAWALLSGMTSLDEGDERPVPSDRQDDRPLAEGDSASLCVLDAIPAGASSLVGDLERPVWVLVNGQVRVRERRLIGTDWAELVGEAARVLEPCLR